MIEEVQFYPCRDVYEEGMALLAGLEDAALDARLLLEHFCGIDTNRLLAEPGMPVSDDLRNAFLKGIERRAAREPLSGRDPRSEGQFRSGWVHSQVAPPRISRQAVQSFSKVSSVS